MSKEKSALLIHEYDQMWAQQRHLEHLRFAYLALFLFLQLSNVGLQYFYSFKSVYFGFLVLIFVDIMFVVFFAFTIRALNSQKKNLTEKLHQARSEILSGEESLELPSLEYSPPYLTLLYFGACSLLPFLPLLNIVYVLIAANDISHLKVLLLPVTVFGALMIFLFLIVPMLLDNSQASEIEKAAAESPKIDPV